MQVDLKDKWRNLMRVAILPPHAVRTKCLKRREVPSELLDRVSGVSVSQTQWYCMPDGKQHGCLLPGCKALHSPLSGMPAHQVPHVCWLQGHWLLWQFSLGMPGAWREGASRHCAA